VFLRLNGIEMCCSGTECWADLLGGLPDGGVGALGVSVRGRTYSLAEPVVEYAYAHVLTYADEEGRRIYERSLQLLFLTAVNHLFKAKVRIQHSFGQGLYIDVDGFAEKINWTRNDAFLALDEGQTVSIVQQSGMKEEEREAFLESFEQEYESSFVAFCVMGGIFSEGIDLTNDKLIGAIVVGTGLPQISNEREILKNHYDAISGDGFDYAFRFPGMNKVLQAAGRVIRTTEDLGVILLLDERFLQSDYQQLYPREWNKRSICNVNTVEGFVQKFWDETYD